MNTDKSTAYALAFGFCVGLLMGIMLTLYFTHNL